MRVIGLLLMVCLVWPVQASRIKDMATVRGVRANQVLGYGLVVGLNGTGESGGFTGQTFNTMLGSFGITLPKGIVPSTKDVAPVVVSAQLRAFSKAGQTLDVTVSAIGQAKSLQGGTLLQTFLKGVDGRVYAIAQGSVVAGSMGEQEVTPTVGRIINGATVEQEVPNPFNQGDTIIFDLDHPDFTMAKQVADSIDALVGQGTAQALDAGSIEVFAPRDPNQRVAYLSLLENITVEPADKRAKIIINSRTGTIVLSRKIYLQPAAITHRGLTVTIGDPNATGRRARNQPTGTAFTFDTGASLDELVQAINRVGTTSGDLMAILEALKQAGAIQGEIVVI